MCKVVLLLLCTVPSASTPSTAGEAITGVWPPERLSKETSVEAGRWGSKWENDYGYRVEHSALSREELGKAIQRIVEGHPRLLLRPHSWKGGLSVDQFRQRVEQEPWAQGFERTAKEVRQDVDAAIEDKKTRRLEQQNRPHLQRSQSFRSFWYRGQFPAPSRFHHPSSAVQ